MGLTVTRVAYSPRNGFKVKISKQLSRLILRNTLFWINIPVELLIEQYISRNTYGTVELLILVAFIRQNDQGTLTPFFKFSRDIRPCKNANRIE